MIAENKPKSRKKVEAPETFRKSRAILSGDRLGNLQTCLLENLRLEAAVAEFSLHKRDFATRAECLLKYGRFFRASEYTNTVYPMGLMKQCFRNSRNAVSGNAVLYCEGVAISEEIPVPIHHAWITEPGNQFTDYPEKQPEPFEVTTPAFDVYFGICFSGEFSRKLLMGRGRQDSRNSEADFWNCRGEYADAEFLSVLDQCGHGVRVSSGSRKRVQIPFVEWVAAALRRDAGLTANHEMGKTINSLQEIRRAVAWPLAALDKTLP